MPTPGRGVDSCPGVVFWQFYAWPVPAPYGDTLNGVPSVRSRLGGGPSLARRREAPVEAVAHSGSWYATCIPWPRRRLTHTQLMWIVAAAVAYLWAIVALLLLREDSGVCACVSGSVRNTSALCATPVTFARPRPRSRLALRE